MQSCFQEWEKGIKNEFRIEKYQEEYCEWSQI